MKHIHLPHAAALAGCAVAAAVSGAGTAAAVPVTHDHFSYDASFDIPDLCGSGLTVHGHAVGSFTSLVRTNRAGFPLFSGNVAGVTTYSAGTHTATVRYAGPEHDLKVVDNGNGTITVTQAISGNSGVVTDEAGTQVYSESGRRLYNVVLDYNGTPGNADDDIFVSETLTTDGPAGADGSLCAAVVTTLGG